MDTLAITSFIDSYVRAFFSFVRRKTFRNSGPLYSSTMRHENDKSTNAIVTNDFCTVTKSPSKNEIRIEQQKVIPPRSESPVPLVVKMAGLRAIKSKPSALERQQVIVARGVANILPLVAVYVLVTTFSTKPVHRQKKIVIARGTESPMLLQQSSGPPEPTNYEHTDTAVHRPSKCREPQMRNYENVNKADEEGLVHD